MKRLWLVGESLPLREDGSGRRAFETANLPSHLVPLDPRHGVFPNLVMKPLFAAGYSLAEEKEAEVAEFFREMKDVVSDTSKRRFNLFMDRATKSKGRAKKKEQTENSELTAVEDRTELFEIDNEALAGRVANFDCQRDLWLVFGHQTNFGLLWWLTNKKEASQTQKTKIKDFSEEFVSVVSKCDPQVEAGSCTQLSSRIGLFHRLCTGANGSATLQSAISRLEPKSGYSTEQIVEILRATVPLLHNEGYQDGQNPTGNAQSHFVRHARGKTCKGDLYWQVMGYSIAQRMLDEFVE